MAQKTPMTKAASQRIQSATARQNGGQTPKGTFSSKTQSIVDSKSSKGNKYNGYIKYDSRGIRSLV